MPGPTFLRGDSIALRPIEEDDLEFLQRGRNDPRIRTGMTTVNPQNYTEAEEAHERHAGDDSGVGLLITREDDDGGETERLGKIVLFGIDQYHGHGELACWVLPEYHGEGYATEATELVLDHAFYERRLHKVYGRAIEHNEGSQRVFEKLGMEQEGHQRDQKFVDGEHVDVVRYGILADEWERAHPQ